MRRLSWQSRKLLFWILAVLTLATASCAKRQPEIVGVWKGDINKLPAVELNIKATEGQLAGTVTFFFQRKDSGAWKVQRQDSQPLTKPKFDGKTLVFEVSHEQAHPDSSGDPPSPSLSLFRLQKKDNWRATTKDKNRGSCWSGPNEFSGPVCSARNSLSTGFTSRGGGLIS